MIGIIGAGLVGARAIDALVASGQVQVAINDANVAVANRVASRASRDSARVSAVQIAQMFEMNVVVLACPAPHAKAARKLLEAGVSVVSCSDDVEDVLAMLDLD
nr:NAD(P)-binding domain-containing protein [Acidobacteriota bacterium]